MARIAGGNDQRPARFPSSTPPICTDTSSPPRTYTGIENVGGLARCATCIRQWRRESPDSLLLDIGDVYQGTAESLVNNGNLMIGLFNRLGYDAWTLGNHDFDWGPEALEKNLALSKSPILTGNIRVAGKSPGTLDGAWKNVLPWMMKEVGGFRIALIGLVTPGLALLARAGNPRRRDGRSIRGVAPKIHRRSQVRQGRCHRRHGPHGLAQRG